MPRDIFHIRRFLTRLRRRSAWLAALELFLVWGTLACTLLLVAAGLGELELVHQALPPLFWMLFFGVPSIWLLRVIWPRHLPFSQPHSTARFVDREVPETGNLTLSALELAPDGPQVVGFSGDLIDATIRSAHERTAYLPASRLLPASLVMPWVAAFAAVCFIFVLVSSMFPERLSADLQAFFSPPGPVTDIGSTPTAKHSDDGPELGDITLSLVYPAYLEREAEVLENSNGEVFAPIGTEVTLTARGSVEPAEASIQVDEAPPVAAVIDESGRLTGAFLVEREGAYRVSLVPQKGGAPIVSRAYRIRVEPDSIPIIEVLGLESTNEVSPNDAVPFSYRAEDDHGVTRVDILVKSTKGTERKVLREISSSRDWDEAQVAWYPSEWDLPKGGTVELWLEVRDNDTVSGPKVGTSAVYQMILSSPERQHEKVLEAKEALKEALLAVLGDVLIQHTEPLGSKTPATFELELQGLSEGVGRVFTRFDDLRLLMEADTLEERTVYRATIALGDALAEEWEALERAYQERIRGEEGAFTLLENRSFTKLRASFIETIEGTILSMESFANLQRMESLLSQGDELRKAGASLRDMLDDLKRTGKMPDVKELLKQLDDMERKLAEMAQKFAQLDRSTAEWFQNPTGDTTQLKDIMDEIRKLLQEGKTDEAMAMLEEYLKTTEDLLNSLEQMQQEEFGDLRDQVVKDMKGAIDGLRDIERRQRQLLSDTDAVKEALLDQTGLTPAKLDKDMAEALKKLERIRQEVDQVDKALEDARVQGTTSSQRHLREVRDRLGTLEAGLRAHDVSQALREAWDTVRGTRIMEGDINLLERRMHRALSTPKQHSQVARTTAESLAQDLERVVRQMEQMQDMGRMQGQGLADRQGSLQQKSQSLGQRLSEYSEGSPMIPGRWGERLQKAAQSMDSASGKLRNGALPGGAADEELALQELNELRKEMEGAQEEMAKQMRGMGQQPGATLLGQNRQNQKNSREHWGSSGTKVGKVDISKEYKAPEDFRREIMEGMKGEVPSRYKRLNRDYYEKLVR